MPNISGKIFSRLKLPSTIILINFILLILIMRPGKYLNDSQCTPVKPVEVRNVYDFPFGAKKKGLTPRSIDASENQFCSEVEVAKAMFSTHKFTRYGPPRP